MDRLAALALLLPAELLSRAIIARTRAGSAAVAARRQRRSVVPDLRHPDSPDRRNAHFAQGVPRTQAWWRACPHSDDVIPSRRAVVTIRPMASSTASSDSSNSSRRYRSRGRPQHQLGRSHCYRSTSVDSRTDIFGQPEHPTAPPPSPSGAGRADGNGLASISEGTVRGSPFRANERNHRVQVGMLFTRASAVSSSSKTSDSFR